MAKAGRAGRIGWAKFCMANQLGQIGRRMTIILLLFWNDFWKHLARQENRGAQRVRGHRGHPLCHEGFSKRGNCERGSQTLILMMQPPSTESNRMTQAQASAPPRGPEMRIASWNLGVPQANSNVGLPHANGNMGPLTISTHMHYQTELCLSGIAGHWAKVAAEILEWD